MFILKNDKYLQKREALERKMVFSYNSGSRRSRWENIKKLNYAMPLRKTFICASALIVFRGNYAKFITYIDMMEA